MFARSSLVRIGALVVAVLFLWALFAGESGAGGPERHYRVKAGDTLWSIAERSYGGDPREGIWKLEQRNHLASATLVPGQLLVVPS
jgi:nucleoid-associated protein YgaU